MSTGQAPARRLRVVDERQRHLDENDTRADTTRATLRPLQRVSGPRDGVSVPAVVDARVARARQRAGEIIAKYTISRTTPSTTSCRACSTPTGSSSFSAWAPGWHGHDRQMLTLHPYVTHSGRSQSIQCRPVHDDADERHDKLM